MRYRLDAEHYIDDKLLPTGTEIGDDTPTPFRYTKDLPKENIKAGHHMTPSINMTPLDDEAKRIFRESFKEDKLDKDPTAAIPIRGTGDSAKTSPPRPGTPAASPPRAESGGLPQFPHTFPQTQPHASGAPNQPLPSQRQQTESGKPAHDNVNKAPLEPNIGAKVQEK